MQLSMVVLFSCFAHLTMNIALQVKFKVAKVKPIYDFQLGFNNYVNDFTAFNV